ncbi:dTDP-4-dehydrorhamnose 3,5-epimerase [Azospirillum halopraeferens]|uniref:dTDP-4-dehydrorhamnose 3,5-epimerase n=1 Tax=Azospirillum halopraeferens TaxID=34010 RepID=UPI0004037C41|nr:dTDP-4-dehydrorhamnose 3,5-epimerase [Azospirillum halopraeferens]
MIFEPTPLAGAFLLQPVPHHDERGFFARSYCRREFEEHGLNPDIAQCSISHNRLRGTLRGLHYQAAPCPEVKLVRCTRGALFDVIVDLRPGSPDRGRWFGAELTAANGFALYIPAGFAHGFVTLADDTEAYYQISAFFEPELARGVRWDDPDLAIAWPIEPSVISARDRALPCLAEAPADA